MSLECRKIFTLILLIVSRTNGKRSFHLYQRLCVAKSLNPFCQVNCTIENPKSSVPSLSFYFKTENDIPNVYGNVHITVKRPNQKPFSFLKMPKLNICQLASGTFNLKLANSFISEVQKHGNFPKGCPMKKGLYYIKNMIVDPDIFPEYLNNLTYQAKLTTFTITKDNKDHKLAFVQYDGEVIKTGGKQFVLTLM